MDARERQIELTAAVERAAADVRMQRFERDARSLKRQARVGVRDPRAVEVRDVRAAGERHVAGDTRRARRSLDRKPAVERSAQLRLRSRGERRERREIELTQRERERERSSRVDAQRLQAQRQRTGDEHVALGERRFDVVHSERHAVVGDAAQHARDRKRRVAPLREVETGRYARLRYRAADPRVGLHRAVDVVARALRHERGEGFGDVGRRRVHRERERVALAESERTVEREAREVQVDHAAAQRDPVAVAVRVKGAFLHGVAVERALLQRRVARDRQVREASGEGAARIDQAQDRRGEAERGEP